MQAACLARCNGATVEAVAAPAPGVDTFRTHVAAATAAADRHLVVAYSRKQFLQTGAAKTKGAKRVWGLRLGKRRSAPDTGLT